VDKRKRKRKRTRQKLTWFFWVSISGAMGADTVGEVTGAVMGDQSGGHGCRAPVQKEKKKEKLT
jgi:hypothetical protein